MVFVKSVKKRNNLEGNLLNKQCHDCGQKIEFEHKVIKNGFLLKYKDKIEDLIVFKCSNCFEKKPGLTNFRKCEVYSRVVGYLRPVGQWNIGKQQEFKERKDYKLKKISKK